MQHIHDLSAREIMPGISGKYVHGNTCTFGYVDIKAGTIMPTHHHVHEQITYVLEGELEMTIGAETIVLTAGMVNIIPSNMPHSAIAHIPCKLIDFFSPVREDYR